MEEIGNEVSSLILVDGQSASEMTSQLKKLGNGDMRKGFSQIADVCYKSGYIEGFKDGEKFGTYKGIAITVGIGCAFCGACYLVKRYNDKKIEKMREEVEEEKEELRE